MQQGILSFDRRAWLGRLMRISLLLLLSAGTGWAAGTAANTLIRNQASATFKDDAGQVFSVTSNMVETLVQQAAGIDLVQDQSKRVSIGGEVHFPHVLTNVGNGPDTFDLTATNVVGSDSFDFSSITLYADLNQDGQPDDLTSPIATTPLLGPDQSFAFVVVARLPGTETSTQQGAINVTGSSQFTPTLSASNVDVAIVTDQAVIDVTKALSATAGTAGSGNYTVTLTYENTSTLPATRVTLLDALPAGMLYVAGSGRWSQAGTLVLTDSNPTDAQTGTTQTVTYCAYDSSCTGLPEATRDADTDSTNQVTAIISQVPAGIRGSISFEVTIDPAQLAGLLPNTGEFLYNDGSTDISTTLTNKVVFEVIASSGVVTNGSNSSNVDGTAEPITIASTTQAGIIRFTDYVWNTGNGDDSFDLTLGASTFPPGTSIQLFHPDGNTPLLDTNGNGIPDTGTLAAAEFKAVVIKVQLPPSASGDNGGTGYQVTLTATSFTDNTQSNPAINSLQDISTSSVDLTNNADLAGGGTGAGAGPEAAAVTTNIAAPGTTTRFSLFVNNTSAAPDNYNLAASTDSGFAALTLPADWSVIFRNLAGAVITNTGNIAAGASVEVYADITLPADAPAATSDIYFRSLSPNTGAVDIKHDAVTVGQITDIVLTPDNQGQVLPGGVVIYSHWLSNQGNMDQADITLTHVNDQPGWASDLYADTDGDGVLSGGDTRLTTVASLPSGASMLIFDKVLAPASAPMGTDNLTVITASWNGGADSTQAQDLTTTNRSDVKIVKLQALDTDCNGGADFAFSYDNFAAEPGQCVMYQLTATNTGVEQMQNVQIHDATPAYTHFYTAGGLPILSQGSLSTPISNGLKGDISGAMGVLNPGNSAVLTFGIQIE